MLALSNADVLCLTETSVDELPVGHVIASDPDYGYSAPLGRRKVGLWSKSPWTDVDSVGHDSLPGGRFVVGTTVTPIGPLRLAGVCIPWRDAHVSSGRKDSRPWQEHLAFLDGLAEILVQDSTPDMVVGDFNQRVPRGRQPREVFARLEAVLDGWSIPTAGEHESIALIDHVALRRPLAGVVRGVLAATHDGCRLSDHLGVIVGLEPSTPS